MQKQIVKRKYNRTKPSATGVLREVLNERKEAVDKDKSLLITGRWTQSTVFYTVRLRVDQLIKEGVNIRMIERKSITDSIRDICDEMGVKRHELGIIAAARAELYFRGESYSIGFDEIEELIEKGSDLIIIEKEGAAEVLQPFADKYGIALLFTRGFATEYAYEVSRRTESNILVLTDFDASGLLIAKKLPKKKNIHWIGMQPEMAKELLDTEDLSKVEEEYIPEKGHIGELYIESLSDHLGGDSTLIDWISYLKNKRIEIDSVLAEITPEDLWNYIIKKLVEKFPYRNYLRSIGVDRYVMPSILEELIENISDRIEEIQEPRREEILEELVKFEGLIDDVDEKESEIEEDLRSEVEEYDKTKIKNMLIEEVERLFGKDEDD